MKVTSISQQLKRDGFYSVYIDGKYSFSLSAQALLNSRLAGGEELDRKRLHNLKKQALDDRMHNNALRYAGLRPRSEWEVATYLERKNCPPQLRSDIIEKLRALGLVDDLKFGQSWVANRQQLKPTSIRKLKLELRQKRVADQIINQVLGKHADNDHDALLGLIDKKRRNPAYADDTKLLQYLMRQGFHYEDIVNALKSSSD